VWNKTYVVLLKYLNSTQLRPYKIIGFFAYIYYYSNERKQQDGENKSDQEIFYDVPINFFHAACEGAKDNSNRLHGEKEVVNRTHQSIEENTPKQRSADKKMLQLLQRQHQSF
jgi:hypothetical protein